MIKINTCANIKASVVITMVYNSTFCFLHDLRNSWALVAHTCNPSYSGGRDQEDHNLKPVWANNSQDPISKISNTYTHKKQGLLEWLKV
jgi:hypothetical protein